MILYLGSNLIPLAFTSFHHSLITFSNAQLNSNGESPSPCLTPYSISTASEISHEFSS